MASTFLMIPVVAASLGFGVHHSKVVVPCETCGVLTPAVAREIAILQQSPNWRQRDNAAHRMAKYDWKCHPILVDVLVTAMLRDCRDDVRGEAAETLGKFGACLPEVHEALALTARNDPDGEPRREARKALKKLSRSCEGPCNICGPSVVVGVSPPPETVIVLPPEEVLPSPIYGPAEVVIPDSYLVPPSDLPAPLPGPSPFDSLPEASRKAKAKELLDRIDRERVIAAAKVREAARRPGLRPVLLGRRPH